MWSNVSTKPNRTNIRTWVSSLRRSGGLSSSILLLSTYSVPGMEDAKTNETILSYAPLGNTFFLHCTCPALIHVPNTFTHLTSSRNAPHISTLPSSLTILTVKIGIFSLQKLKIKEVSFIIRREKSQILLCLWLSVRNTKSLLNLTYSCSQHYYINFVSHL